MNAEQTERWLVCEGRFHLDDVDESSCVLAVPVSVVRRFQTWRLS
jgi:hypothetical protein